MKKKAIKAVRKAGKPRKVSAPSTRYVIKVKSILKGQIWIVGVIDTKDGCLISIDHASANKLYRWWLKQHFATHGKCMVTPYSFDEDNDPVEMQIQVWG